MHSKRAQFLCISGSIRNGASSTLLLQWMGNQLAPAGSVQLYDELASIPPYDGVERLPYPVERFITYIRSSSFVIFCSPEYAHGVPGSLKNALDWTVASDVWINKPVAVITAAAQGEHAHASLMEVLSTMSAKIIPKACVIIAFIRAKITSAGEITDAETEDTLRYVIETIKMCVEQF